MQNNLATRCFAPAFVSALFLLLSTSSAQGSLQSIARPCSASQLEGSTVTREGAAGTIWSTYRLRNVSPESCSLQGFPGVRLLDAEGRVLGVPTEFDGLAGGPIVLKPGSAADFTVAATNVCAPDSPWPRRSASWLLVILPHERGSLLIKDRNDTCRLRVRTLVPASAAHEEALSLTQR